MAAMQMAEKKVWATVIPRGNSSPILEPAKHDFYFAPLFIKLS